MVTEGDGEGEQDGGGISLMECLGKHTFPKQHLVTQLVLSTLSSM